jgi:hypothetical protein
MRRLATVLLVCALPLLAENWGGLYMLVQAFTMLFAILPMPFILLYAWLVATGNRSLWLREIALICGSIIILAPMVRIGTMGLSALLWAAAWFGIGYFTYRKTQTSHPVWVASGLFLLSIVCAFILTFYILMPEPAHRY